ncbi:MAG: 23S rRNA (guanosine(2251)-2'-O)-methyltransferase RlmB [Clostridia bacterium]|nr:23S rRNA (guanosine(2251)-2'-O)-methyltransferase RlmB [Clostridia bacterium]
MNTKNKRFDKTRQDSAKRHVETVEVDENLIYGRNAVMEAIKSGRDIEKIFMQKGEREGSIRVIAALARERSIPFVEVSSQKIEEMTASGAHQGVAALCSPVTYVTLDDLFAKAEEKGEAPFFVICDDISDPHNLGAIIRSAECCGVNGVILPKRHSAPITSVAVKASAGAVHHMPIAKVSNIATTVDRLKECGVWIYGAEAGGKTAWETDMKGAIAVVMGSEGNGISRLVKEKCDFIVSIPMYGQVNSFNVSCAASIILCEAAKQRH